MKKQELNQILDEGEGYKIEFKENLSALDKELTAFANASGGRILMGVADDGTIKGLAATNALKSQVQDLAHNCDPSIKIVLEECENVLVVNVPEGTDKPYRCKSGFYSRVGPNAQKLKRNELLDFIQSEGKIRFDELINKDFSKKEFDSEKLGNFLRLANISKVISQKYLLKNLGAGEIQGEKLLFNNTSVLFFAKNVSDFYFHTAITCALYKGIEKVTVLDRKDFNDDLVSSIDKAMLFLKQHLKLKYEFDGSPKRIEIPEIPYNALREAIINAAVHRDYFNKGANVMIEVFDDRVDISSPGGLVKGLEQKDFGTKSMLRNPTLANLLHRINYIEKMGTGIQRIQMNMKKAGLPPVKYAFTGFVTATFYRTPHDDQQVQAPVEAPIEAPVKAPVELSGTEIRIVQILGIKTSGSSELLGKLGYAQKTGNYKKSISSLVKTNLVEMTIPDKPNSRLQKYRLTAKGHAYLATLKK